MCILFDLFGTSTEVAFLSTLQKSQKIPSGCANEFFPEAQKFRSEPIEQTIERLPSGTRRLAAQLSTPISIDNLWSVLTDYNNLSTFIPNLTSSHLVSRNGDRVHLQQVGSQKFIGIKFSASVHLELEEDRNSGILKFKLLKGDFRRFEGSWRMREIFSGRATCLVYELIVQGCIGMPVSLIESRLREDLTANMLAVESHAFKLNSDN